MQFRAYDLQGQACSDAFGDVAIHHFHSRCFEQLRHGENAAQFSASAG